jgi:hypothetical protein
MGIVLFYAFGAKGFTLWMIFSQMGGSDFKGKNSLDF